MARGGKVIRRTVPWTRLLDVARAAPLLKEHWDKLTAAERRQLQQLVRKSKGKPSNLNMAEKAMLRRLVRKLELGHLSRDLVRVVRGRKPKPR